MEESSIRVSLELLWKWRLQQQQQQQAHARVVRDVSSVLEAQQNVVNKQRKRITAIIGKHGPSTSLASQPRLAPATAMAAIAIILYYYA